MPLDSTNWSQTETETKPDTEELLVIDRIIGMLFRPDQWCKIELERSDGAHCIMGALWHCQAQSHNKVRQSILVAIQQLFPDRLHAESVMCFNDHPDTTHADVMAVISRARALLASRPIDAYLAETRK